MNSSLNIFLNKKILIYGLGKSGLATFNFLKKKCEVFLYDDYLKNFKNLISYKNLKKTKFDFIIISPGIDINKCKLSKFLKKNLKKIYTDLDIFFSFFKNDCITITGTNGKSTTCQLLYEILLQQKYHVKLVGNIGNPILSLNKIRPKTIFIVEASSYQLEYSKIFRSKYSAILNLSPDHIERHKTLNRYIKSKFKLLQNQLKHHFAFVKKDDLLIKKHIKFNSFNGKIIRINTKETKNFLKNLNNKYFSTETNKENLSFVFELSRKLKLRNSIFIKTIQKFNGLKYRQQIIFKRKYLTIINDSKSTSFSSSINLFYYYNNIFWILGGQPKKNDKFDFKNKKNYNVQAYIFGKNKKFFTKQLKNKMKFQVFPTIKKAYEKVLTDIKKFNIKKKKTILFSPSSASFDEFKNFEERGAYFNFLVKSFKGKL